MRKGIGVGRFDHVHVWRHRVPGVVEPIHSAAEIVVAFASVAAVVLTILVFVVIARDGCDDLEFTAEHHGESFAADRFLDAGETSTVSPFVEFAAKCVGFHLDEAEFPACKKAVAARGMNVSNGRVHDRGLGRAADLGQIGEQGGQVLQGRMVKGDSRPDHGEITYEESTVESLSALTFNGVVSSAPFGGVGTSAGLPFHLSGGVAGRC